MHDYLESGNQMTLRKRFNSLLDEIAVMPAAPAAALAEHTSGGDHDYAPRGAFQRKDEDRIEEILTEALQAAESLLGRVWKDGRHVAKRHREYDQREWEESILTKYKGVRNRLVAAEENVEYYVVRDLRKKHGLDGYGKPKTDTSNTPVT